MESSEYRDIISGPHVLRRTVIEATVRRLAQHSHLVARLERLLQKAPVTKPPRHAAGAHSDFLIVDLTIPELEEVVAALGDNEVRAVMDEAPSPELSYASTLQGTWNAVLLFRKAAV